MERKFPYHSKNYANLSKAEKEKLSPEEKHWLINRDMNMQVSNMDSFGSFALIFIALVFFWAFSDSEIAQQVFGKSLYHQRIEREKIRLNNAMLNY